MKVKAKFKGANGSLGYETGKVYDLSFTTAEPDFPHRVAYVVIHDAGRLWDRGNEGSCSYSSLRLFLNNWDVIA